MLFQKKSSLFYKAQVFLYALSTMFEINVLFLEADR